MATPAEKPAAKPAEAPKAKPQSGSRSPNYPQINFAQAVEKINKVYQRESTHSIPDMSIAEALGYTTLNGTSRTTLSALKKYGLLVPSGDGFKVGQEAHRIIELSGSDAERVSAMRKLGLRPPVFKQLQEKYPGKSLPGDTTLRLFLMDLGFEKEAANQVMRVYKETLQYLEKEAPEQALGQTGSPSVTLEKPAQTGEGQSSSHDSETPPSVSKERGLVLESVHLRFHVSRECDAEIAFFGPVTEEAIDKLIRRLELSKEDYPSLKEVRNQLVSASETVTSSDFSDSASLFGQDDEEDYDNSDEDYSDLDDAASE